MAKIATKQCQGKFDDALEMAGTGRCDLAACRRDAGLGARLAERSGENVVGFAAGGSTDIIARDMGHELEKVWGQPVIVENRAGANGAIAAGQLAKPPPDGQTLMRIVSGHVTNGHLNPKQSFDALKDFTPIASIDLMSL